MQRFEAKRLLGGQFALEKEKWKKAEKKGIKEVTNQMEEKLFERRKDTIEEIVLDRVVAGGEKLIPPVSLPLKRAPESARDRELVPEYSFNSARSNPEAKSESESKSKSKSSAIKNERKAATEWIEKQLQYTHRAVILERDRASDFGLVQQESKRYVATRSKALQAALCVYLNELQDETNLDSKLMKQKLMRIKKNLTIVKQQLLHASDSSLQQAIDRVEDSIADFRTKQRDVYEKYVREQVALERDLNQFQLSECSEHTSSKQTMTCVLPTESDPEGVEFVKAIERIDMELQEHENSSKWTETERDIFERLLRSVGLTEELLQDRKKQHVRMDKLLDRCGIQLASRSLNECRDHFQWYCKTLRLQMEKKEKIYEWRQWKAKLRQEAIKREKEMFFDEKRTDAAEPNERKKKIQQERKRQALEKWHRERERKAQEEKDRAEKERARKIAQSAKKQHERAEIKQQVSQYKLRRENEKTQQERLAKQVYEKPSQKKLLETSRRAIEQAKAKHELRIQMEKQKKMALTPPVITTQCKTKTKRDPERLIQQTKAFQSRAISKQERQKHDADRTNRSAHEKHVPGGESARLAHGKGFGYMPVQPRAVPTWRKGL